MADNNQIAFTDWYMVIVSTKDDSIEMPVPKFLKALEKKYKSDKFNIIYNEDTKEFAITYNGEDFSVEFNSEEKRNLESGEYSPLLVKLMFLATQEKIYNDIQQERERKKQRLNEILNSSYDDMKTVEDYELLLDYLENKKYREAKTEKERNTVNTMVAHIIPKLNELKKQEESKITNPLNLRMHINKFIYDLLTQTKQVSDDNVRVNLVNRIKKIIADYRKIVDDYNRNGNNVLYVGNPLLPMQILDRINEIQFELINILKDHRLSIFVDGEFNSLKAEIQEDMERSYVSGK